MKYRFTFIIAILIFGYSTIAQTKVFTEWKYLQLTNIQGDLKVISDNYRNAELVVDSIINSSDISYPNSHFLFELAKAYQLNQQYSMMAFSLLRQQCLAPNDSLRAEGVRLFQEACLRLDITESQAVAIYKTAAKPSNIKRNMHKLSALYTTAIQLFNADVDAKLMEYYSFYNSQKLSVSPVHKQWEFLTRIDLGMKKKKTFLTTATYPKAEVLANILRHSNKKLQKRIIMRAEHYYRKTGADGEAKRLMGEYKKLNINIFNTIQMSWRLILGVVF